MYSINIPECIKPLTALKPQADGSLTSRVISLKNVVKAYLVVNMNQVASNQCTISLLQATSIAAGTNKAISNNVRIWDNADLSTNDTLAAETAAKTYQFSATTKEKMVVFEIDPSVVLDVENDYDCVYFTSGGSSASNIIAATWILDMKYREDVPPTVVTD